MNKIDLTTLTNEEILNTRIKDLKLELPMIYQFQIKKLYQKLKDKKIMWRPHLWASDEWFSPDGIGGIAYSFVLCHPRLIKLEKQYLGFCEGENPLEFFKLLCHETGHAIDNAFRLRSKKKRQLIFGLSSRPYPSSYRPKPDSINFVKHLDDYYAQAHPDEDWAETFAVWLSNDTWHTKYKNTPALEKLLYVDHIMKTLPQPKVDSKRYNYYLNDTRTVRQYLLEKRSNLKLNRKNFYAKKLNQNLFNQQGISVASFISKNQKRLIGQIKKDEWITGKCLKELKDECKRKKYKLKYNEQATEKLIINLLNESYDEFVKKGRTRVYM